MTVIHKGKPLSHRENLSLKVTSGPSECLHFWVGQNTAIVSWCYGGKAKVLPCTFLILGFGIVRSLFRILPFKVK